MTFHRATQLQGVHLYSAKKLPMIVKLCLNGDTNGHACRPSVVLDLIHQQTGALKKTGGSQMQFRQGERQQGKHVGL